MANYFCHNKNLDYNEKLYIKNITRTWKRVSSIHGQCLSIDVNVVPGYRNELFCSQSFKNIVFAVP